MEETNHQEIDSSDSANLKSAWVAPSFQLLAIDEIQSGNGGGAEASGLWEAS